MRDDERYSLWVAEAALRAANLEVPALTLEGLEEAVGETGDLELELRQMRQFEQKGGDFGAEILGPVIIPLLIEAGKQLWKLYFEKLTEKAADQLAEITLDKIKTLTKSQWSGPGIEVAHQYEVILRAEAERQGFPLAQIESLIVALHRSQMIHELNSH